MRKNNRKNSKIMKTVPQQYTIPPPVVVVKKKSGATAHCCYTNKPRHLSPNIFNPRLLFLFITAVEENGQPAVESISF